MKYRLLACPKVKLLPLRFVELPLKRRKETVNNFPARNFIRAKKVSCSHQNGLEAGEIL